MFEISVVVMIYFLEFWIKLLFKTGSIFNWSDFANNKHPMILFSNRITFNFLMNSLAAVQSEYCLLIRTAIKNEVETVKAINFCSDLVLCVFMCLCVYVLMCICICKFLLISFGFIFCKTKLKLQSFTNIYVDLRIITIFCF